MEALTLDSPKAIYSTAIAAPVVCWLVWSLLRKHREPYPPGPPGYPIIGSIFSFPKSGWQRAFTEWQKRYGDLIYANVLGSSYIIINSLSVAEDLCSRRANIYSNRPKNVMMTKLMGWEWNAGIMQPGPRHTAIRKLFRQTLGPQVIATYDPMIQKNAEDLIKKLHNFEGDPFEEIVSAVGAVVITVAYGENVYKDHGKELTQLGHEALETAIYVMTRFWLVEIFPSLRHIPAWTPGATFRQIGVKASQTTSKIYNWPWEEARRHYNEGTVGPCIAADCMEQGTPIGVAQDSVAVMFGAGVNTTTTSVINFLYAMMLHPHLQQKVQAELDDRIGQNRIISGEDIPILPYAEAAWRESWRWHAPVPLGVSRSTSQADIYNGMYIPKDSTIMLNVEFMLRDPRTYDQPEVFQPERWLESHNPRANELPDAITVALGFGTRGCAGRHLAERAGFAFALSLLSAFDIVPMNGGPVPDWRKAAWAEHGDSRPLDFKCSFKPRSEFSTHLLGGH